MEAFVPLWHTILVIHFVTLIEFWFSVDFFLQDWSNTQLFSEESYVLLLVENVVYYATKWNYFAFSHKQYVNDVIQNPAK